MTVDHRRKHHRDRLLMALVLVILCLTIVSGRLVQLMVVDGATLAEAASDQWRRAMELPATRGAIYDRDGEPLALSVEAYDVYATPSQVVDPVGEGQTLAETLGGTAEAWREKLTRKSGFVYLARRLDAQRTQSLKSRKNLHGVGFIPSSRRTYRIASGAAQVVGLSGLDGQGLTGLERYYDTVLKGTPGVLEAERDPKGRALPGGIIRLREPVQGRSIRISLDSDIQYKAQVELYEAVRKHRAKGGIVLVLDPRTGEILAAASSPGADPSRLTKGMLKGLRNRAIEDAFEPGSTMKIVTVAAALEEGVVRPTTRYVLAPTITVGGHEVHEAHSRGTEEMTVADILARSSNVGAVTLGLKLGKERLYGYIERFGLASRTGVDFPSEAWGKVPEPKDWWATSIGTIPFGQGIMASPLQMARVMAIVANDGVAVTPHFLESGLGAAVAQGRSERVISKRTARELNLILRRAVTTGTGTSARIPGYTVAGKTGTAQKVDEGRPGYKEGAFFASFIGMAPATHPRLVGLVAIDEPTEGGYFGGVAAAPVFSNVMRFALSHLRIPPDDTRQTPGEGAPSAAATSAPATKTEGNDDR